MEDAMFMSVSEASRKLGLGETIVWSLINSRDLKSIKVGRRRLIDVRALEDFRKAKLAEAAA